MRINLVGPFIKNFPFGTEIAFKKGFDRLGGHQVTCIDPNYPAQIWDHGADATIVFKWIWGEALNEFKNCGGKKIVYQPDDIRFSHIRDMMEKMRWYGCDYALTFDDVGAGSARALGYEVAEPLLLTADDELYHHIPGMQKDIDFCFVGSMSGADSHRSRRRMVDILTQNGFRVLALADLYNIPVVVNIYNRSKVVLNHATDVGQRFGTGYGYQCRVLEAGFTRSCVLTNKIINESEIRGLVEFDNEESLLQKAQLLLSNEDLRKRHADELFDCLNNSHRPEHRAQQLIDILHSFGVS